MLTKTSRRPARQPRPARPSASQLRVLRLACSPGAYVRLVRDGYGKPYVEAEVRSDAYPDGVWLHLPSVIAMLERGFLEVAANGPVELVCRLSPSGWAWVAERAS